ncbi:hypothetical protein BX070DRAFT_228017 [Coemansia spiralis]|nr:hypothetical protein BX070DRAFT_228017 [Coemansia spiralis]
MKFSGIVGFGVVGTASVLAASPADTSAALPIAGKASATSSLATVPQLPPSKGPENSASTSKPSDARSASANLAMHGSVGALVIAICGLTFF